MTTLIVHRPGAVEGTCTVPGDKAIAHRGLMLGAIARGRTVLRGLSPGEDVASTAGALRSLGIDITVDADEAQIDGRGIAAFREPASVVDCRNSGTTMRILAGLAARFPFRSVLDGDASLRRRPMDRVAEPLRTLGARVSAREGRFAPLEIEGGSLVGAQITPTAPSGQVKSAILLAGLGASGRTAVVEPHPTRDDTERMLEALGVPLRRVPLSGGGIRVEVEAFEPDGFALDIPGDPSSAAFVVAAGLLRGTVRIEGVCLNPTRAGFLDVATEMRGAVRWTVTEERMGEPVGWVEADRSMLTGLDLRGPFPRLVDELPLVAVLATQAKGTTTVRGAEELRVKESDRISAVCAGLTALGARITEAPDGFTIEGPTELRGGEVDASGDHRMAMAFAVAGLVARGDTRIRGFDAAGISWPGFADTLAALGAELEMENG